MWQCPSPQAGVHPRSGHTRHTSVLRMGPLEVSVQQVTCDCTPHFTFLQSVSLRWVTRDQEIAREELLVP